MSLPEGGWQLQRILLYLTLKIIAFFLSFKNGYVFKLLHFFFLFTQMPTCWARGWVARKAMKCSFFPMVLLYCGWYGAVTEDVMSWAAGRSASGTQELLFYARSCLQGGSWLRSVAGDLHLAAWSMLYCTGCVLGMQVSFCVYIHCLDDQIICYLFIHIRYLFFKSP